MRESHSCIMQDDGRTRDRQRAGKKYWRSLEELADTPEFREFVEREYPQQAEEWNDPVERRTFLKLMGASLALAGLERLRVSTTGKDCSLRQAAGRCTSRQSTVLCDCCAAWRRRDADAGSQQRRPADEDRRKSGSSEQPQRAIRRIRGSSATDIFSQASILSLYDPDRSQTPLFREEIRTWTTFVGEIRTALDEQRPKQGAGIRFLTETITSPTLAAQLKGILTEFPQAKWHQYEPVNNDNARAGAMMAFGQPVNTIYDFSKADRILSLDADFLAAHARNAAVTRATSRRAGE